MFANGDDAWMLAAISDFAVASNGSKSLLCNRERPHQKCFLQGLFRSAGQLLRSSGLLITYGPYRINGTLAPITNIRFDESLRAQNPQWGIRDTRDLERLATGE